MPDKAGQRLDEGHVSLHRRFEVRSRRSGYGKAVDAKAKVAMLCEVQGEHGHGFLPVSNWILIIRPLRPVECDSGPGMVQTIGTLASGSSATLRQTRARWAKRCEAWFDGDECNHQIAIGARLIERAERGVQIADPRMRERRNRTCVCQPHECDSILGRDRDPGLERIDGSLCRPSPTRLSGDAQSAFAWLPQ